MNDPEFSRFEAGNLRQNSGNAVDLTYFLIF